MSTFPKMSSSFKAIPHCRISSDYIVISEEYKSRGLLHVLGLVTGPLKLMHMPLWSSCRHWHHWHTFTLDFPKETHGHIISSSSSGVDVRELHIPFLLVLPCQSKGVAPIKKNNPQIHCQVPPKKTGEQRRREKNRSMQGLRNLNI